MSVVISVQGTEYTVPSNSTDTNWAAQQVAFEQALAAGLSTIRRDITPVGTTADTNEDNLMTYSLNGNTLFADGQGIRVTAWGDGVATANTTIVRGYFGSTAIVTKVLTASQANTWRAVMEIFRTGAATQTATGVIENGGTAGSVMQGNGAPTETMSNAITIKFTGQRATSSVANSVRQLGMVIERLM